MVILRTRNKITDFFMILAWASPFNLKLKILIFEIIVNTTIISNIKILTLSRIRPQMSLFSHTKSNFVRNLNFDRTKNKIPL